MNPSLYDYTEVVLASGDNHVFRNLSDATKQIVCKIATIVINAHDTLPSYANLKEDFVFEFGTMYGDSTLEVFTEMVQYTEYAILHTKAIEYLSMLNDDVVYYLHCFDFHVIGPDCIKWYIQKIPQRG